MKTYGVFNFPNEHAIPLNLIKNQCKLVSQKNRILQLIGVLGHMIIS